MVDLCHAVVFVLNGERQLEEGGAHEAHGGGRGAHGALRLFEKGLRLLFI